MEFEDSRNALFVEPNAYVQNYNRAKNPKETGTKKVVFQEPYDCLPSYHMNNGFRKDNCNCVPKRKPEQSPNHENKFSNTPFGFDLKSLAPLIGLLGKDTGGIGKILSSLNSGEGGFDFTKLISSLLPDRNSLSSILNLF